MDVEIPNCVDRFVGVGNVSLKGSPRPSRNYWHAGACVLAHVSHDDTAWTAGDGTVYNNTFFLNQLVHR